MDATLIQIQDLVAELKADVSEQGGVGTHKNILELDNLLRQFSQEQTSIDTICATLAPSIKSFRQMFEMRLDTNALIEFLLEGAQTNVSLAKFDDARDIYEEIIILADSSSPNTMAKAEAIKQIGHINSEQEQWQQAEESYRQATTLYEDANNLEQVANIYNNLGYNTLLQGDYSQAKEYHQQAIQTGQECNNPWVIANAHDSLGIIASVQANWDEAIDNFEASITQYDEIDDLQPDDLDCMAQTYHNLAMAYVDCEEFEEAGKCYQEATQIAEELGKLPLMASIYINRAEFFLNVTNIEMARVYCDKALEIFEKLEHKSGIAEAHKFYGCIYQRGQDWDAAIQNFNKSIEFFKSCNNLLGAAETYCEFGLMYKDKQELEQAKNCLNDSLKIFEQLEATDQIERVKNVLETLPN